MANGCIVEVVKSNISPKHISSLLPASLVATGFIVISSDSCTVVHPELFISVTKIEPVVASVKVTLTSYKVSLDVMNAPAGGVQSYLEPALNGTEYITPVSP